MNTETHSFAEIYAKDFEAQGHARLALNKHGEPAKSRASTARAVVVTKVESLSRWRTRLTIETGRTITVPDHRWILAEHYITEGN